jgi:hypothetical protein
MTDNTRRVPCSTPSRRTPFVSIRVHSWSPKNPAKMPPKCRQKRECHFFNASASGIYNFAPQNWSHFPDDDLLLRVKCQTLGIEPQDIQLKTTAEGCPFSLGEKVTMRDKPVSGTAGNLVYDYCMKMNILSTKMNTCGGGGCVIFSGACTHSGTSSLVPFLSSRIPYVQPKAGGILL